MGDPAEVFGPTVDHAGLEMGMRRVPEAKVHQGTPAARFEKLPALRAHLPHACDMMLPSFDERPRGKIVGGSCGPKRKAEPEPAVVTDSEAVRAGAAMEEMITPVMEQCHFAIRQQGREPDLVRGQKGDGRPAAGPDVFKVARRAVKHPVTNEWHRS